MHSDYLPDTNVTVYLKDPERRRNSCGGCTSTNDSLLAFRLHTSRYQSSIDVVDGQARRSLCSARSLLPLIATLSRGSSSTCRRPLLLDHGSTVSMQYAARDDGVQLRTRVSRRANLASDGRQRPRRCAGDHYNNCSTPSEPHTCRYMIYIPERWEHQATANRHTIQAAVP